MKTIAEALAETMALAAPLVPVSVPLSASLGRLLAHDEAALLDMPLFDTSLVDGYAVRTSEIRAGGRALVRGEARAGTIPDTLGGACVMRIFTGAPVPDGADAVVMQEVVSRDGQHAIFERDARAGAGIRRRGSDFRSDEVLLRRGTRVDAGAIALLASQGYTEVSVSRPPRVAIVTTGDEVHASGQTLGPGGIYDANGPMLAALIVESGGVVSSSAHVLDDLGATIAAIDHAILVSDLVLTVGGVSVGDHDLVHDALSRLGVERTFWRVRMKPGKPLAVGRKGRVPVIGLPGNPVSAWVGFEVFVRPMIRRMSRDEAPYRRVIEVPLGASIRASPDRTELARARLDDAGTAWPFAKQGSSALTSVTGVDALLILPERDGEVAAGERVRAMRLDGRGSDQPPFAAP